MAEPSGAADRGVGAVTDQPAPQPMQIGEIAERTGLSLRTLRHYDEIGLLVPSARSEGGFRLYAADDLAGLLVIRRMKPLGFSLDAMREVMRLLEALHTRDAEPDPALVEQLDAVLAEARDRRTTLQRQLAMADEFIELLGAERPTALPAHPPAPASGGRTEDPAGP